MTILATGAPEIGDAEWVRTVTASKVPAILGLSPWTSAAEMWLTMRGEIDRDSAPSSVQQRGHDLEPMALRLFWTSRKRPAFVQESGEINVTRDDLPFPAAASPDSSGRDDEGARIFCEAKTVGNFESAKKWGREGTDEIPVDYFVQVQWQMLMDQAHEEPVTTTYVSLVGPVLDDHKVYRVDFDRDLAGLIVDRVADFYASLVNPEACPAADGKASTVRIFARRNPEIDKDERWEIGLTLAAQYAASSTDLADAEERLNTAKGEMLRTMGTARIAYTVLPDGTVVDVARRQKSGKSVALYSLKPDLHAAAAAA